MERWREDEKCFGGNEYLSQLVNETHRRENENHFGGSVEMQSSQNKNGFQRKGHKIEKSRTKIEDEENLYIIKNGREGNIFPFILVYGK